MTTKALQTELSFIFGEVNDNKDTVDRTVIYMKVNGQTGQCQQQRLCRQNCHLYLGRSMTTKTL